MTPISVPFAPTSYRIIVGIPLLLFAILTIRWGWKNLCLTVQMLRGNAPLPPGSSPPFAVVGLVLYLAVLAVGGFFSFFFLAIETTGPTVISDRGVIVGARPPLYRQELIAWQEVTRVRCGLPPRHNQIRSLVIESDHSDVALGNAGVALEGVRAVILARTPKGTVQTCRHNALDHWWSY